MRHSTFVDSSTVKRARQKFLVDGDLQSGVVDAVIERSWRRCLDSGIDVAAALHNRVETAYEYQSRCEKNELLLAHAKPEMATLNEQIAHTRSIVLLTDAEGVVVHRLGDDHYMTTAEKVALMPGCSWHENARGTNAIGTALAEGAPVSVRGAEHYLERNHVLSCSAVPIFNPNNSVLGTLDVSSDYLVPQQNTLSLVKMAAQMIENRLFHASNDAAVAVHFHARPEFIGTMWEGIALFNDDGELVAMNRSGQFQLGLNPAHQSIYSEDLFNCRMDALVRQALARGELLTLHVQSGMRLFAQVQQQEVIRTSGRPEIKAVSKSTHASIALARLNTGDAQMALAIQQVSLVLDQDIPVLIEGETGAGKELFAQAIHDSSLRRKGPFVAVNCAALPEGLIEAELFGYEEGAFTGARRKGCTGKLEQANGGTLFLDEIGDMPLSLQARLLRVLQERRVTPLGSNQSRPLDIVLVSATNQNLRENVEKGQFRRDLYYRLNGLSLRLPALRERTDLPALVAAILREARAEDKTISPEVMEMFASHPWPGNVRQLHNVLKTAIALSAGKSAIGLAHLTQSFLDDLVMESRDVLAAQAQHSLDKLTYELVQATLQQHGGNVSSAARQLGISRNTLYRKLKMQ
jgi:transcriptional regulator of acetoin/glycerol metabolism